MIESDAELLARFQEQGQQEALAQLYNRYVDLVYGLCLNYLNRETEAEDAVMAIFETLLAKVPNQDIAHFRNWLYTYVRNHCLMQLRREKRHLAAKREMESMHFDTWEHPIVETDTNGSVDTDLYACLEGLNEQQKACVAAFYLQGMSYQDIAEQRKEALGTVRSNIQNGRRNLRRCMEAKVKAREIE